MEIDPQTRQKIEESVMGILKEADLDDMTEFKLRVAASAKLGFDLSQNHFKRLVRTVLESFLLLPEPNQQLKEVEEEEEEEEEVAATDRIICKLSRKKYVAVRDRGGSRVLSIYIKDKKEITSQPGISLTDDQWSVLRNSFPAVEEAIRKMEMKLRLECVNEQIEDASKPVASSSNRLCPIEINRFDGKNYHTWMQQMKLFLEQLNLAYVLIDPCPITKLRPESSDGAKAAELKWETDDYRCRHHILTSLSDHLFYKYSNKSTTAKELWEQLRLVYLDEEFGTTRSQVKKYIEYQIVDEKSIPEQVQELNNIADAIVGAGIPLDEKFHVNVIISKLPSSRKEFCMKLFYSEPLSFRRFMDHLIIEEETQKGYRWKGQRDVHQGLQSPEKHSPSMNNLKQPGTFSKKRKVQFEGQPRTCFACGKKGHISRDCHTRKLDKQVKPKNGEEDQNVPTESRTANS